jgi:hypothetical protein
MREYTVEECTTLPPGLSGRDDIRICPQIAWATTAGRSRSSARNPFPAVIGRYARVPARRNADGSWPTSRWPLITSRFAADFGATERRSGPALSRASAAGLPVGGGIEDCPPPFSARLSLVAVFEATPKLGGMLRSAIAKERLPEEVLEWDIQGILDMGVTAETRKTLGKDFTVDSLLEGGYEAVFLAAGGWDSRLARGMAATVESVIPGTFLLVDLLRAGAGLPVPLPPDSDVVIYGGGKLALDAAKRCRDLGARAVTILFRESWDKSPLTDADVAAGGFDGLNIRHAAAIQKIFGEAGRLTGIEVVENGKDQAGVCRP